MPQSPNGLFSFLQPPFAEAFSPPLLYDHIDIEEHAISSCFSQPHVLIKREVEKERCKLMRGRNWHVGMLYVDCMPSHSPLESLLSSPTRRTLPVEPTRPSCYLGRTCRSMTDIFWVSSCVPNPGLASTPKNDFPCSPNEAGRLPIKARPAGPSAWHTVNLESWQRTGEEKKGNHGVPINIAVRQ